MEAIISDTGEPLQLLNMQSGDRIEINDLSPVMKFKQFDREYEEEVKQHRREMNDALRRIRQEEEIERKNSAWWRRPPPSKPRTYGELEDEFNKNNPPPEPHKKFVDYMRGFQIMPEEFPALEFRQNAVDVLQRETELLTEAIANHSQKRDAILSDIQRRLAEMKAVNDKIRLVL
jgi:uncharacterized coiled-coil DUF342 family protein